ncbi:MAG TPA: YCF48-related protein [Candidatus Binatia bacterium]|nr:YCF48-related protein [Candidatus Binatia bacterium]
MLAARQFLLAGAVVLLLAGASYARGAPGQSSLTYISAIQVDPKRPTVIYAAAGHHGVLKSADDGQTWSSANEGLTVPPGSPPNSAPPGSPPGVVRVDALALNARSPNLLYAGTGLGVFKTTDGARTWKLASNGIDFFGDSLEHRLFEGSIWGLSIDPVHPSTVYAASFGGVWKTNNGGASWKRVLRDSAFNVGIDPRRPKTVYAAGVKGRSRTSRDSIYKTVDGGVTWRASGPPGLHDNVFGHPIVVDRQRAGMIYAGGSRGLFISANQGGTWTKSLALRKAFSGVNAIALDPVRASVLYVGTSTRGVMKSVDAGQTWSTPRLDGRRRGVSALAIARTRPQTIYAGVYEVGPGSARMFASTDGGATWRRLF